MKRRTEEYTRRLDAAGAQWSHATDDVPQHVVCFETPQLEYAHIQKGGLGLIDACARDTLLAEGDDVVTWLQGLVTNDVFALAQPGAGQRTHAVNHIGRTIADIRIAHLMDMLIMDFEPGNLAAGFLKHLRQHIIMEKVRLHDRSSEVARITLIGDDAPQVLDQLADPEDLTRTLRIHHATTGYLGTDVTIQRVEWAGTWGFDIMMERREAHRVWDKLIAQPNAKPVGFDALEVLRKEAGIPRFGSEYDERVIPIEADLNDTINYDKGCYLGQEVIHRLDTRGRPAKMLRAIVPQEDIALASEQILYIDKKKVGVLRSAFHSPKAGRHIGLAYVKRGAYDSDTLLDVLLEDGTRSPARVVPLRDFAHTTH